jgi:hypothetical protein
MTILGVDPGTQGAIAALDDTGALLWIEDMPSTTEANGRTATNAPLLAATGEAGRENGNRLATTQGPGYGRAVKRMIAHTPFALLSLAKNRLPIEAAVGRVA